MVRRHGFFHEAGAVGLRLGLPQLLLDARDDAVGELAGLCPIAAALRVGELVEGFVELLLQLGSAAELVLLGLPARRDRGRLLLKIRKLLLEALEALLRGGVGLFLERLGLDLPAHDLAVDVVELLGLRVDLHAQPRGRLVDEVDRLVGQEAVGDVAVRQRRRRDERRIRHAHAVVLLVLLFQAAQDRDRVLDRGLADEHRLEAPRQRRVLLDVLPVLVERRRADAVQLAAGERRLQEVRGVHRAFALAGPDERVHLVDEQDAAAVTSCSTALRRSSNSPRYFAPAMRAPMSRARSFFSFSDSGTSPLTMRSARPSTIAVLPTPGSPMRTGLFLVRRDRTWMVRRISSSRPITGSSLPSRAASVRSRAYFFSAS